MKETVEPVKQSKSRHELIDSQIETARKCLFAAKDSAIEAAAYAFLVWRATETSRYTAKWIDNGIDRRNEEIRQHNKAEKDDRARALKHGREMFEGNDLDQAQVDHLIKGPGVDDKTWKLNLKVSIEARENSSPATRIVKFIFNFDSPADAGNTSRYSTVLEWIEANCRSLKEPSEIVHAIKNAGGFDKVIQLQRLTRKPDEAEQWDEDDEDDAADPKTSNDSPPTETKRQALKSAPSLASFKMKFDSQSDDLLLLLGRYRHGTIEIIKAVSLPDDEVDSVIERFDVAADTTAELQPDSTKSIAA